MALVSDATSGEGSGADAGANRTVQAYNDLRALLLSGHYEPDSRLTESDLTTRLGVSRGTLRSVLARLAQEGYVTAEAHRSARTRSFSVDEALEILETREVLESALAASAARRATDADVEAMTRTCERMWECQVPGGRDEYQMLNRRFHEQIRETARHATLSRFVDSLLYPLVMQQYRHVGRAYPRTDSVKEHEAILATIATRNPEAASAAMKHHLSAARRDLELQFAEPADL
ncbi:FCD domain-containing protein [Streptomyces sp. NPDC008150]|uniref:GntR family transcriptional regulator n=1 Tax=Streptomyces sp. NPDC008150 TaxID=3364816 RepID=UPI0036EDEB00